MNLGRQTLLAALFASMGFVPSACAQNGSPGPTEAPSDATAQPSSQMAPASALQPATAKKVWTNDDVSDLRSNSVVSTVGPRAATGKPGDKSAPAAKNGVAKSYQDQIARLQAQIPPIDSQIAELQAAIDGKPTGDGKDSTRPRYVKIDDWSAEMQQLQKKRDDIQTHVKAVEEQARLHGVPANQLP